MTFLSSLSLLKLYYDIPSAHLIMSLKKGLHFDTFFLLLFESGLFDFCCNDILDFRLKDSRCISHFQN